MPLRHTTSSLHTPEGDETEPTLAAPAAAGANVPTPSLDPSADPARPVSSETASVASVAAEPAPTPALAAAAVPEPASSKPSGLVEGGKPAAQLTPTTRPAWAPARLQAAVQAGLAGARSHARPLMAGGAVALALGFGYLAGSSYATGETAAGLAAQRDETARLAGEVARLRVGLDASRAERGAVRTDPKQAQLLDKVERTGQENAARIGRLSDQLERIEKGERDTTRAQLVLDRIDRLERALGGKDQTVAASAPEKATTAALAPAMPAPGAPTPPPKPASVPDVAQTGSIPDGRAPKTEQPDPRKTALEGYVLREVDEGYALIETRSGRFHEVSVGQVLPGIGRVEAIERRGRQWVVVTPKGFISERWN